MRSTTSSVGARTPTVANVGSTPISVVAAPIVTSAATRTALRPTRSPRWPATTAPIGRAPKPAAYVAKAARVPAVALMPGKKSLLNTRAVAVA